MHKEHITPRKWFIAIVNIGLLHLIVSGCEPDNQDRNVPIILDFVGTVHWEWIATKALVVYENEDTCDFASDVELNAFDITTNADNRVHLQFFEGDEGEAVGELEPGAYVFVGLALDFICFKEYVGCTVAEVGGNEEITISLDYQSSGTSFCGVTSECNEGYCTDH